MRMEEQEQCEACIASLATLDELAETENDSVSKSLLLNESPTYEIEDIPSLDLDQIENIEQNSNGPNEYEWEKEDFIDETKDIRTFEVHQKKQRHLAKNEKRIKTTREDWEWLKYWYNSKPKDEILTDEDVVSVIESERRIFILFLTLSFCFLMAILSLIGLLSKSRHQPKIWMPSIPSHDIYCKDLVD